MVKKEKRREDKGKHEKKKGRGVMRSSVRKSSG